MDAEEEAGLRAFALKVGCYAGASYPERPLWVERDGVRTDVAEVESRWLDGYTFALSGPIYAGTNEIQRNIVAERILGLPREPKGAQK